MAGAWLGLSSKRVEELERLIREKDEELRKLKDEKDDEIENLKKQLEDCRRELEESWSSKPAAGRREIKFLALLDGEGEEWGVHVMQRLPVPPETFLCNDRGSSSWKPVNSLRLPHIPPMLKAGQKAIDREIVCLLDEQMTERSLVPPKVEVETREYGQFDRENWWFAKALHHEGGLTMLAYYDGDRDVVQVSRIAAWRPVRMPYPRDADVRADRSFFLAYISGRTRLAFAYRE